MATKRERLNDLIRFYAGGNKAAFARMLDMPRQSLNNWFIHDTFDIEKIYQKCDGLSADWLLSGDGEMLACNRPGYADPSDYIIPIIHKEALLAGDWSNREHYLLIHGAAHKCDFITMMPNGDFGRHIGPRTLLFCTIKTIEELIPFLFYIVLTVSGGPIFVQFIGREEIGDNEILRFTTMRDSGLPNMRFEIPVGDIKLIAVIVDHTINSCIQWGL